MNGRVGVTTVPLHLLVCVVWGRYSCATWHMRYQRFGKTKSMGEGVKVARVAVHQLTTVLCLSALAVIIAVLRLLLNTMVIFAAYLLLASAFWVMVCFVMITALITAMFVLLALPTLCSSALSACHVTLGSRDLSRSSYQSSNPIGQHFIHKVYVHM